jgi:hypothetical protein
MGWVGKGGGREVRFMVMIFIGTEGVRGMVFGT